MIATFRWEFRNGGIATNCYAEGILEEAGRPGDKGYFLSVYLVRDEMKQPAKGEIIDPDNRIGTRVYVGAVHDREACALLAHLAPIEGSRRAYTMIYNVCLENVDRVEKFGDEWLTDLMKEKASA